MTDSTAQALAVTHGIRASAGYAQLPAAERAALDRDLSRLESALSHGAASGPGDPYAVPLETPAHLGHAPMSGPGSQQPTQQTAPTPAPAPRPAGTEVIGARARQALEAVNFPEFVAGLITGTFQAIIDATTQQIREYARLVASLAQTVDGFSRGHVSPGQVRDWLAQRHPADLVIVLPKPGDSNPPKLMPRRRNSDSPAWLADYGLKGNELTPELTEGALLEAGRSMVGEERMQTLATMVLMGVNRIVVNEGQIRARLQFHASAREAVKADIGADQAGVQQTGIASRQPGSQASVSTVVSTISVNAQADVAVRANLVGEVAVKFRSETFNLERFADSQAIELITQHSRMKQAPAAAPAAAPEAAS